MLGRRRVGEAILDFVTAHARERRQEFADIELGNPG